MPKPRGFLYVGHPAAYPYSPNKVTAGSQHPANFPPGNKAKGSAVRLQPDTSPPGLGFWRPLVDTLILAASTVADTEEKPGFSLPAYLGRTPKPMGIMGSGALSRINISDQNPGGAGKVKQRAECVGQPCPWRCMQACFQRLLPGPRGSGLRRP